MFLMCRLADRWHHPPHGFSLATNPPFLLLASSSSTSFASSRRVLRSRHITYSATSTHINANTAATVVLHLSAAEVDMRDTYSQKDPCVSTDSISSDAPIPDRMAKSAISVMRIGTYVSGGSRSVVHERAIGLQDGGRRIRTA
jgi:hypothetical protein